MALLKFFAFVAFGGSTSGWADCATVSALHTPIHTTWVPFCTALATSYSHLAPLFVLAALNVIFVYLPLLELAWNRSRLAFNFISDGYTLTVMKPMISTPIPGN